MNTKYRNYTFHILMGLPGSGKTYFTNTEFDPEQVEVLSFDTNNITLSNANYFIKNLIKHSFKNTFVIDGLILTKENLESIIISCITNCKNDIKFVLHYWQEDRQACLNNDKYRIASGIRDTNAASTIKTAKFDAINEKLLNSIVDKIATTNIKPTDMPRSITAKYISHKVYQLNDNEIKIMNKYNTYLTYIDNQLVIAGEEYCLGGTSTDWHGTEYQVDAEDAPEFKEFDDVLMELCPNITFLQYKKLYNNLVHTHKYTYCGYYANTNEARKYCVLSELLNYLKEMQLI